jgi:hypothetical protein
MLQHNCFQARVAGVDQGGFFDDLTQGHPVSPCIDFPGPLPEAQGAGSSLSPAPEGRVTSPQKRVLRPEGPAVPFV